MTFKDELLDKVQNVRLMIKTDALNCFTETLKSEMISVAEEGRTSGSIHLSIMQFTKLEDLLISTNEIYKKEDVNVWLLEQVKKGEFFRNIEFEIDENYLQYNFDLS